MSWLPGWDSIAASGWWSGFYFWASIVSLIGLGISEIASHRYSERRDELVDQQQLIEKKQHDDQIARLQLETAETTERAEQLKADNLRLQSQLAPRNLSKEQFDEIQTLNGRVTAINLAVEADSECEIFAAHLAAALMNAGITIRRYSLPPDMRGSGGLIIYDQHIFSDNSVGSVIFDTLSNAKVAVVAKSSRLPDALVMPRDIPAILVYEKPSAPYISPPYFGLPASQANPTSAK